MISFLGPWGSSLAPVSQERLSSGVSMAQWWRSHSCRLLCDLDPAQGLAPMGW